MTNIDIPKPIVKAAQAWLSPVFDTQTQKQVTDMLLSPSEELLDSFYKSLEFGTGGMRGIMGVGTNRINKYTLGKASQGIANYLNEKKSHAAPKVVIAYDNRNNSKALAQEVAHVFSANEVEVYLFSALRPTPLLSFAVRELDCDCGIVLTASHNPPEYNGYKVYWKDGGQIVPPIDSNILNAIADVDYEKINFIAKSKCIHVLNEELDNRFIQMSFRTLASKLPASKKSEVKIAFSPLHGTAITLVPQTLKKAGFNKLFIVEEQAEPDGYFRTVSSPNPEDPAAFEMVLDLARQKNADVAITTDPDCDRLGIAIRDSYGDFVLLNGNQTMVLMTAYLLEKWSDENKLNGNQFIASTIVSSPMLKALADKYAVKYKNTLTGFKWIAKLIEDYPELEFICGGEESYGFMIGDKVRDKDAVTSSLLICEMVAEAKAGGYLLYSKLLELYREFGLYKDALLSFTKKGEKGVQEISAIMKHLRLNPFTEVLGEKVVQIDDYQMGNSFNVLKDEQNKLDFPTSNVLTFFTEHGLRINVRPSGTEPKIKLYINTRRELTEHDEFFAANEEETLKIDRIKHFLENYLENINLK